MQKDLVYFGDGVNTKISVRKPQCPAKIFKSNAGVCAAMQILKPNVLQFHLNFTEFQVNFEKQVWLLVLLHVNKSLNYCLNFEIT